MKRLIKIISALALVLLVAASTEINGFGNFKSKYAAKKISEYESEMKSGALEIKDYYEVEYSFGFSQQTSYAAAAKGLREGDITEYLKKNGLPVPPELRTDHKKGGADLRYCVRIRSGSLTALMYLADILPDYIRTGCREPINDCDGAINGFRSVKQWQSPGRGWEDFAVPQR